LDYSDLTVIIPTLNERGSIKRMINVLARTYNGVSVIVADDGSMDGTREIVRALGRGNKKVRLLDRSKKKVHGLTASVLDAALITNTKKIVVMDGDMQHPPSKVGSIARGLDSHDLVVGVRTVIRGWSLDRRIISKGMTYLSYTLFLLSNRRRCNDMMSGFFGINSALLKELIKDNRKGFVEEGYKVLLDILRMMGRKGTIGEVGYSTFHLRKEGNSKFRFRHVLLTLKSTLG
jgi:dolichol-phosphate mannosyltransferase